MIVKNIHEKLLNGIQTMLIDTKVNLPYYGEFNLHIKHQITVRTNHLNIFQGWLNDFLGS